MLDLERVAEPKKKSLKLAVKMRVVQNLAYASKHIFL
jgi:hypothetical protein